MTSEKKYSVIIVAGGRGYRVGGETPKQFIVIAGKPMLMHTIEAFYAYDSRVRIVVVLPEGYSEIWKQLCNDYHFAIPHQLTVGGETRFHSVRNGLIEISNEEIVGIHDAARPFVSPQLIGRCFDESFQNQCGIIPVVDEVNSVRQITESGSRMLDRELLKIVQTPQVFPASLLKEAYRTDYNSLFTDDASVAEKHGIKIQLVNGDNINIKITTLFDVKLAEYYFRMIAKR